MSNFETFSQKILDNINTQIEDLKYKSKSTVNIQHFSDKLNNTLDTIISCINNQLNNLNKSISESWSNEAFIEIMMINQNKFFFDHLYKFITFYDKLLDSINYSFKVLDSALDIGLWMNKKDPFNHFLSENII